MKIFSTLLVAIFNLLFSLSVVWAGFHPLGNNSQRLENLLANIFTLLPFVVAFLTCLVLCFPKFRVNKKLWVTTFFLNILLTALVLYHLFFSNLGVLILPLFIFMLNPIVLLLYIPSGD